MVETIVDNIPCIAPTTPRLRTIYATHLALFPNASPNSRLLQPVTLLPCLMLSVSVFFNAVRVDVLCFVSFYGYLMFSEAHPVSKTRLPFARIWWGW